ncbi:alpha/beta hydrolase family esterase [Micromonospora sp. NPDC004704]
MKRAWMILLTLAAVTGAATGCSTAAEETATPKTGTEATLPPEKPAPGDHTLAFRSAEGAKLEFLLHAPPGYAPGKTYPLVVALHGSEAAETLPGRTGLNAVADANGFLVAYPKEFPDAQSVGALLDHLVPVWGVDTKRVHATGFSRGATLAYDVAERLADRFASVAPVSGSNPDTSVPSRPLSLITFQGGDDRLSQAWPVTNTGWDKALGCGNEQVRSITMEGGPTHVYTTTCPGGTEHVVYSVARMGHAWPADASRLMWEFFTRNPLP